MADFDRVFDGFGDFAETGTIADLSSKNTGKRILVLIIVDATKSMEGTAIGQVNYALQELLSELKNFSSDNVLNMQLGVMSFTNSIKWELRPTDISTCYDTPQIAVRPGQTQFGVVYHELNKMLNKEELLKCQGKQAAPVLILLTDGAPSDDYKDDLAGLKKNGYFMMSSRAAVIMGEGANDPAARAAAGEFAMNDKMVLTTDRQTEIVNAIKLTTLHTLKGQDLVTAQNPSPAPDPFPDPIPAPDPFPAPMPGSVPDPDIFTDSSKVSDPFADSSKAADPFADSSKVSDPFPDSSKVSDPFSDSSKAADPFPDSSKAADPFVDSSKTVDPFADSSKTVDPFADSSKAADPFPDPSNVSDPFANSAKNPDPGSDIFADPAKSPAQGTAADSDSFTDSTVSPDPFADPAQGSDPFPDPFTDPF